MIKLVVAGILVVGVVAALEAPAVVWSGVEAKYMSSHYEMRSLEASAVGSILERAEAAVKLLVVVPDSANVFTDLGESGRRLSAKASVLPFVKTPASASEFAPSAETMSYDENFSRRLTERQSGGLLVAVASETIDLDQVTKLAEGWADAIGRPQSYVAALAVSSTSRRLQGTESKDSGPYEGVRMTPDIMAGVLVAILFIFIGILGFSCIGAIQTPSQFAKQGPPSLKEW